MALRGMVARGVVWWCVWCAWWPAPARAVVGGAPAVPPEPDAAVVFVQKDGLSARLEGVKDDALGYYQFLGIRYAEPAVGARRFQRAVRRRLAGELAVRAACAPCPQPDPYVPGRVLGAEDCLCLNVYAPKMPEDEQGSPVVFFIHGGNYRSGSTTAYGGQHLAQKDTILVTAQYRLGSLGFLSTGQWDADGNLGLFDLHSALTWVYEYITFFGGDPSRVVVMGQGSGGSAASLLALSAEGRGARGVLALSGAPLSPGAVRSDPAEHARQVARNADCPTEPAERLVACLRKQSLEKIIQADSKVFMDVVDTDRFLQEISGKLGAGARVEGEDDKRALPPLVSEAPADTMTRRQQRAPLLTGVTSAETSHAVYGKYSSFLKDKLATVRDFIKTEIVGNLRGLLEDVEGLVPKPVAGAVSPLADYYQAIFDNSLNTADGLAQIAEATADALFNLPAYQSVRAWSEGASAYLYSFEHVGNLSRGSHFLPGVPLAEKSKESSEGAPKGPSHGDELAYIFEALDSEGRPSAAAASGTDARVRHAFTGLVSRFAHALRPIESDNSSSGSVFTTFDRDHDKYLKIGEDITVDSNFRFCQMGLWGDMGERLTSVVCKNLLGELLDRVPALPVPIPALPPPAAALPTLAPSGFLPFTLYSSSNKETKLPKGTNKEQKGKDKGRQTLPNIFGY